MWPRLSIVVGLLAGMAVAGLVLGGIVFLGPAPTPPPIATPSPSTIPAAASASAPAAPSASTPGASATPAASAATLLPIGEPAPALVLPKVGGGTVDLASLKGLPVWIDFMGTSCAPCEDEFPLMNGFAARYADSGLVVVAVDVREDDAAAAAFAERLGATFPVALDGDGAAAEAWGAATLPVHYWIDADGVVRDRALGAIGPDVMVRGVGSILPGVDVQP